MCPRKGRRYGTQGIVFVDMPLRLVRLESLGLSRKVAIEIIERVKRIGMM